MLLVLLGFLDLTSGVEDPVMEVTPPAQAGTREVMTGKKVLWDQTHGPYLDYKLMGSYTTIYNDLVANGFTVDTTVIGVNNVNLNNYDIVVINLGSNWNSAYSAAEADSLLAFVNRGGSLLIQSENTGCPNGNLTQIANRFGMTVGTGACGDCFTSFTGNATYTPIFSGIASACGIATGSVGFAAPSEAIGWSSGVPLMVGRCEQNKGGVLLIGDINIWDNTYIGNNNNRALGLNVFNWLSAPPCAPTYLEAQEGAALPGDVLRVSPNPARNILRVSLPAGSEAATLFNCLGAPVMSLGQGEADISGLSSGVYFLRAGGQVKRVVKR